ncbi:TonB-dependent siderophore receptor [Roseateles sp. SL47]|uniref:TonB-dependent siderophore receptor n=1 Tax=Roseateles sp. SL47 TaxID=2995138 RepID=UPI0022706943|nr:TonB-dependent siderophore receptor [Roseateles sp. SL47]WAC73095.1 TonB-dependent siderophore receptor [Roseateles sp. SL47]
MNKLPPLTTLALACLTLTAHAQSETPSQTLPTVKVDGQRDTYKAPDTATGNRTLTPSLQSPQSVQVISRAVLDDQNTLQLSDALRNVSGVQFDFGFNGSAMPLTILRGFPSVSMTAMGAMSGGSTYYLDGTKVTGVPINMANVQSVEVVKGPASVLYGRAEPGGLVNVISKPISSVASWSLEQTVGQYGLSRTAVEASGALNDDRSLRGRVSGSYSTADSVRDFVRDKLGAFSAALAWQPSSQTTLTATLDYSDQRYRTDYGVPAAGNRPADLPWSRQFNDSPELSSSKTTSLRLELEHRLSSQWQIKSKLLSLRSDTSEVDIAPYRVDLGAGTTADDSCPGTGNPICRYYFNVRPDGRYKLDQFNVDLIGRLEAAGLDHTLLFGVDVYSARKTGALYFQQVSAVDIYEPALGHTAPLDPSSRVPDLDDSTRWTSVYVQDQVALGHGVFLTGALRHDRTSAIYAAPGTEPNKASFTTPRLGAVWQFAPNQSIYAQYQDAVSTNNGRDTVTGAALPAERGRQFEVGHKVELLDGKLSSTLAVYELTKRNRSGQVPIDEAPYYNIVTVGKARSRGLEWDLSGQVSRSVSVIASYAYTDTRVLEDPSYEGKRLTNVARHAGSVWARYAIDSQWSTGAGVFAQGQREGDLGNTFQLPGYARVDAMLAYRFGWAGAKASLQLNVDNLFDKKYYTASHPWSQDWIKLGSPRAARATLRLDY